MTTMIVVVEIAIEELEALHSFHGSCVHHHYRHDGLSKEMHDEMDCR
jgi:hypothetical protein